MIFFGAANAATTVFSGSCYINNSAVPPEYYLVNYDIGESYSSTELQDINISVYSSGLCTAGTKYQIVPSTNGVSYDFGDMNGTVGVMYSCTACASGYELAIDTGPFVYGTRNNQIQCNSILNLTVQICKRKNNGGSSSGATCTSSNCKDSDWSVHSTTYVKRTKRSCSSDKTTCNESTQYACNYGYYGNSGSTTATGCNPCPKYVLNGTKYATTTSMVAASNIGSCYVQNATFNDSTGTFVMAEPYGPGAATYCTYNLGLCSDIIPTCSTVAATSGIINGSQAPVTGGTNCWCYVMQTQKSFSAGNLGSADTCSQSCKTACMNQLVGHDATNWEPGISWTDLGC